MDASPGVLEAMGVVASIYEDDTITPDSGKLIVGQGYSSNKTIRWALTIACFHLFNNSKILDRLRDGLFAAIPNPLEMPSLTELQRLPYLGAYIEKTLRLSYGVTQRSPRLSGTQPTVYGHYILHFR